MSEVVIRQLTDFEERVDVMRVLGGYAFEPSPPLPEQEEWEGWLRNREESTVVAAFDGEQPLAMASSAPMRQQVRGKLFPMSAIWGVATQPAARRNGYIRLLLGELFQRVRAAGAPVTCLYPFRPIFYERFGYVTFPQPRVAKFDPRVLAPLLKQELPGTVEMLSAEDALPVYRAYLEDQLTRIHGMALTDEMAFRSFARAKLWVAVARVDGEVQGLMTYKNKRHDVDELYMDVYRFYAHTVAGRYLLLDWFARHADQVSEVRVRLAPDERPETWFGDLAILKTDRVWPPMGRVLDIAGLNGLQTGPGRVTVQLDDPLCPWNTGVWTLDGQSGALAVSRAAGEPDCTLSIQALSALIYGTHEPQTFALRGWGDPAPAVLESLAEMFPLRLPYLHEEY